MKKATINVFIGNEQLKYEKEGYLERIVNDIPNHLSVNQRDNFISFKGIEYEIKLFCTNNYEHFKKIIKYKKNKSDFNYYSMGFNFDTGKLLNLSTDSDIDEKEIELLSLITRNFIKEKSITSHKINNSEIEMYKEGLICNSRSNHLVFVAQNRIIDTNGMEKYIVNNIVKYLSCYILLNSQKIAYEEIYDIDDDKKIDKLLTISKEFRKSEIDGLTPFNNYAFDVMKKQMEIEILKKDVNNHADVCFYHNQAQKSSKLNKIMAIIACVSLFSTLISIVVAIIK